MTLPVAPPLVPMLGRRADALPAGDVIYQPKWDGLRSRHDRPLARYFPELVEAMLALGEERVVLDGETVVTSERGLDFEALLARVHPARSRVERLSRETPGQFVAFDLVVRGDTDLRALRVSPPPAAPARR